MNTRKSHFENPNTFELTEKAKTDPKTRPSHWFVIKHHEN